ncbi:MAG TPA: HDOD domain-containing protein [Candidatus Kapabacteria bacterium]|nr:HDOD domain-containing protein [Candidatus Kapabacteria bacterium]
MNAALEKLDFDTLPTLPTVYIELMNKFDDPKITITSLSDTIILDISSTTKLLQMVNSSIFSFKTKINTVTQAISLLGLEEVRHTILTIAIMDFFGTYKNNKEFQQIDIWRHSIAVGLIAKIIGKEIGYKGVEQVFIAGLTHDIGKLIMLSKFKGMYLSVVFDDLDNNEDLIDKEYDIMSFNHCDVGYLLAQRWNLSSDIAAVIKYHHKPDFNSPYIRLISIVYLANIIAKLMGLGNSGNNYIPTPDNRIWEVLGLPTGFLKSIYSDIISQYRESLSHFKL